MKITFAEGIHVFILIQVRVYFSEEVFTVPSFCHFVSWTLSPEVHIFGLLNFKFLMTNHAMFGTQLEHAAVRSDSPVHTRIWQIIRKSWFLMMYFFSGYFCPCWFSWNCIWSILWYLDSERLQVSNSNIRCTFVECLSGCLQVKESPGILLSAAFSRKSYWSWKGLEICLNQVKNMKCMTDGKEN